MQEDTRPEKMLHVIVGTPDDENCPICRAHAKVTEGEKIPGEKAARILVQELSVSEMLRCSCPLCTELRQEL